MTRYYPVLDVHVRTILLHWNYEYEYFCCVIQRKLKKINTKINIEEKKLELELVD